MSNLKERIDLVMQNLPISMEELNSKYVSRNEVSYIQHTQENTNYIKIYKEYKAATTLEIWEGVRDNFIFGFIGATLVVFIATKTVLLGYIAYYLFMGKIVNRPKY